MLQKTEEAATCCAMILTLLFFFVHIGRQPRWLVVAVRCFRFLHVLSLGAFDLKCQIPADFCSTVVSNGFHSDDAIVMEQSKSLTPCMHQAAIANHVAREPPYLPRSISTSMACLHIHALSPEMVYSLPRTLPFDLLPHAPRSAPASTKNGLKSSILYMGEMPMRERPLPCNSHSPSSPPLPFPHLLPPSPFPKK